MRNSVRDSFKSFNVTFEADIKFMYLDIKGLVTVGVGNLIDPIYAALALPFRYKNKPGLNGGQRASQADIEAEWRLLKGKPELAARGHRACEPLTKLELDEPAMNTLIAQRLQQNESFLKMVFSDFDQWPADAQMGLLSMAWAMGPGFTTHWPSFTAACKKTDFAAAAENSRINEAGNPGVIPRNVANKQLFRNAAAVLAGESDGSYDREPLYYPEVLDEPTTITP
jgi:GH24 family phage-related lysozyme (muramidase)